MKSTLTTMKYKFLYNSPDELPISKYLYIQELCAKDLGNWKTNIEILSIYTGISIDELLQRQTAEIQALIAELNSKLAQKKTDVRWSKPSSIVLNGHKYTINYGIDKLNVAQYIDFQTYLTKDNTANNLHRVLSVFLIPKGHKYNEDYDMLEVQNDIYEHMPIKLASDICFFMKKQSLISIKANLMYFKWVLKIMKWKEKNPEQKQRLQEMIIQTKNLKNNLIQLLS